MQQLELFFLPEVDNIKPPAPVLLDQVFMLADIKRLPTVLGNEDPYVSIET